jgi:hypothetical protein
MILEIVFKIFLCPGVWEAVAGELLENRNMRTGLTI